MRHYFGCLFWVFFILLSACETENESVEPNNSTETVKAHYDYVQLDSGITYIYEVDSLYYDDFKETIDTYSYQVSETIKAPLDSGSYEWLSKVLTNKDSTKEGNTLFTSTMSDEDYQVFRNNKRIVKLKFPVRSGKTWDGNAFNYLEERTFRYESTHQPFETPYDQFDSTVTVIEKDEGNLIEEHRKKVVYAKGIGKVYQKDLNLRFRGDSIPPETIPWEEKANTGYIKTKELKNLRLP